MKATEQYFHVVLFIMLYNVVITFQSVDETLVYGHSNRATEQYFHVVLFMLHKDVMYTPFLLPCKKRALMFVSRDN